MWLFFYYVKLLPPLTILGLFLQEIKIYRVKLPPPPPIMQGLEERLTVRLK